MTTIREIRNGIEEERGKERRWKKKKNKPDIAELSSRSSFMKPSSLTPVYCIRLRPILPDIIRITLFMLSFIRAVFRQPHSGVIYTRESGQVETKGDGAFDDFNEAI